jgi:hypothetical protein
MQVSLVRRSFCFAVLAFRVETLYLARRFCGLRACNVNPDLFGFVLVTLLVRPGETGGLYAATSILNERKI